MSGVFDNSPQWISPDYQLVARNVYISLSGAITAMPFDTGRDGLWKFDGQVWWL